MASNIVINIGAKDAASKVIAGVGKNVAKLGKTVDAVGVKFTQVGKSIAGIGLKIGAIGLAGAASFAPLIAAGSELQETMGKFDVVFGENAETMTDWSKTTAAALGTSRVEMAKMLSGMQDLLVPVGVMPEKATDMSKTLATLAVDLGSFNNMDTANVFRDLQAAITGSSETMKKYGVVSNEAAVKQELLNQGLDPKSATNAEKAIARLNIILASTTAAQGDAIRTASGAANQWKRFKSTIEDISGVIGSKLLPVVESVLSTFNTAAVGIRLFVDENATLAASIVGIGAAASASAIVIAAAALAIGGSFALLGTAITGVTATITALGAVASVVFSPIGVAVAGVVAVVGSLAAVMGVVAVQTGIAADAWKWFGSILSGVAEDARTAFQGVSDALTASNWKLAAQIAWAGVKVATLRGLEDIGAAIETAKLKWWASLKDFFMQFVKGAKKATGAVRKILKSPMKLVNVGDLGKLFKFESSGLAASIREERIAADAELKALTAQAAAEAKKLSEAVAAGVADGIKAGPGMFSGLDGIAGKVANVVGAITAAGKAELESIGPVTVDRSAGNQATQSRLMTGGGAETTQKQILNVSKKQAEFQKNTAKLLEDLLGFFENKPPEPVVKLVPVT